MSKFLKTQKVLETFRVKGDLKLYQFNFVVPLYCCIFTDGKTTRIYYQRKFERA
jgi:hypothetical protein